ncbi:hypothetical protein ACJMK2_015811 [Sinanodonta woodiana]|uniref:Uncharacterized protein n=1 Tax=Sinanodonta woodiana TaxID=1069815 RepID=A0ABD3UV38_SINWO
MWSKLEVSASKAKGSEVIKQPKRQVIESIITSLDSVDSGSENLFAPNLKVTQHRKKKLKTIIQTPDLISSDLSDVYSDCQKSSPVKKSVVYADETNKCSSHRKGTQSDKGKHLLSKLPVSIDLKGNASYHGNSSSSESKDNSAPGKSKLNISQCRRKMSSRSSSESDLISNSNSSSDQTSESEPDSDEQKIATNSPKNMQAQSTPKMKIKSPTQKEQGHKRISSSSDIESESDMDLDNNKSKSASTKVKLSSTKKTSLTATTGGSKDLPLKGKHLLGSKAVIDAAPDFISESDSDGSTSPVIQKQNIKRHITESQDQSTVIVTASPSSETEAGRSKSTNHRRSRKVKRFQCPEGFEEAGGIGDTFLPIKKSAKKEFWLIKTPWDFDIKNLDRATIPLAGSIRLAGTKDAKHFEVMSIPKSTEEVLKMGTLLADENLESLICGPSLAGQIHVIESSVSLPLVEIQVQPKTRHQIPQNLKERYVPFGAECPVWTIKANGIAGEKKGEKRKHEEVEKRKKKKKKKKVQG